MNKEAIDGAARILWDYHHMNHSLDKADIIFVLGSHDIRVAEYAARLYLDGWAPLVLFSGGSAHHGDLLNTGWEKSEAEVFADKAVEMGVPEKAILLETEAHNTGENASFSGELLRESGISFSRVLAVQKPYMERRTFATLKVHWREKKLIITSPPIAYEDYPEGDISWDSLINIMVGDLQRIIEYPKLGFQIEQIVPADVMEAYGLLIDTGFTEHLIKPNN